MESKGCEISMSWLIAIVISFSFNLIASSVYSQNLDYTKADSIALATPDSVETTISDLADYFAQQQLGNLEIARAAYRWITNEIAFDTDALYAGWPGTSAVKSVLNDKLALCNGYAILYSRLLDAFNIENRIVEGHAKGVTFNYADPELNDDTKHIWNSLRIDGKWYLVDVTFGSGYINHQKKIFVKKFSDSYFLSPPRFFIYNHYPNDSKWQLLERPISKEQFLNLARVSSRFNKYELEFTELKSNYLNVKQESSLLIEKPDDVLIACALIPSTSSRSLTKYIVNKKNTYSNIYENGLNVKAFNTDRQAVIEMIFHEKRVYTLYIFAKNKTAHQDYEVVATIDFENRAASPMDYIFR